MACLEIGFLAVFRGSLRVVPHDMINIQRHSFQNPSSPSPGGVKEWLCMVASCALGITCGPPVWLLDPRLVSGLQSRSGSPALESGLASLFLVSQARSWSVSMLISQAHHQPPFELLVPPVELLVIRTATFSTTVSAAGSTQSNPPCNIDPATV